MCLSMKLSQLQPQISSKFPAAVDYQPALLASCINFGKVAKMMYNQNICPLKADFCLKKLNCSQEIVHLQRQGQICEIAASLLSFVP